MRGEVVILSTVLDPASINITSCLQELGRWEAHEGYISFGNFRLVVLEEELISIGRLEDRLTSLGLFPDLVVFASRHQSRESTPWLGGHFTGFLGRDQEAKCGLSTAAPRALRSFLHNLRSLAPGDFAVSAEATHHGPGGLMVPSFFAEIGSTVEEWTDPRLGRMVARSILDMDILDLPVFLGFGGGHYVSKQTDLLFDARIAFGHLFSTYQIDSLNVRVVDHARSLSRASYAFVDRKSLRSAHKTKIYAILEELGLPVLDRQDILARFPASQI
jgi:D-aminoacyl-tRNA deacylase